MTEAPRPRRLRPGDPALAEALALVRAAFAYMDGVVDPPSSIHRLLDEAMEAAATDGEVWAAGDPVAACVTLTPQQDALNLGKLAVAEAARGRGLARLLVTHAEARARALALPRLRLQSRTELVANHATFAALGFVRVGATAHPGYASPTSLTFEKELP
ncbi:acetyltransferase [Wenxinia marina]|uniref:Putative acyltransferase n=1 Tax=Wenxinia marina DSM 24838 TaxID=1123501 RepID=A0A0D0Q513_9RHOB|nr:GNAT family N-acetyltransferase [Wenxinia marina]KIQ67607.1 putative acyltransferase [Wenxinia marina DSM 24838]GGL68101.1 acetyltransferase [Wenxinia marina]